MCVTPCQPIGQAVAFTLGILLHDLAQVLAVAAQGIGQHLVQATTLPVRQEQEHRRCRDHATHQGVEQARQEQSVTIAHLIEAKQNHQGDGRRAQGVARGAVDKEHHPGHHGKHRLHQRVGKQIEQRPAHGQADGGADNPLAELAPRGAVAWLAHEQRGEDDPVTLAGVNPMHHRKTDAQGQRQAQGVAEDQRRWRQMLAQARPDILEVTRRTVQQAAVGGIGQGVGVACIAQQAVEGAQVGGQRPQ